MTCQSISVGKGNKMRQHFIKMQFYETYYYANIIHNVLDDPYPFIRNIHAWYEDQEEELLLPPFPKWSRLHDFTAHIIRCLIDEEISDSSVEKVRNGRRYEVWVDRALKFHGFECEGFRLWLKDKAIENEDLTEDHLADYHNDLYLSGPLNELIDHLSNEVFHILFNNRQLLAIFNELLARTVGLHFSEDRSVSNQHLFERPGKLKRVTIPEWAKRAVFHRDRGMCASCNKDLSGLITAQTDKHFDHMVPLAVGGLNDVTNIQLLCEECNLEKSSKPYAVSSIYESWY